MKLKNKLIISFFLIVMLPILMAVPVYFAISAYMSVDIFEQVMQEMPGLQEFMLDMAVAVVLILIFTALVMIWWLYSSIVTPIRRLQIAARNIKEGRLNVALNIEDTHDEISLLGRDFEEMRQQLKAVAEENLIHDKEGKELIRNISHDLKTPITSIKGYVEGIMDGVADTPEKQERYLKIVYNKTIEMDRLINELTLYSQLDTNTIPYDFQVIPVNGFFDDCAEEISMELSEKEMGFRYENFCKKDTRILADPEQLHRVVSNIVSNSVKYSGKKDGRVRLSILDEGKFVKIEIEDNGRGIAKGDLPYIFDRFFRTDESRNSSTGGSGIGLSIVKKIIEDHGGKIWATSEFGQGTTMYIILKKYEEENADE
jgi:signal transduction histidine kinase